MTCPTREGIIIGSDEYYRVFCQTYRFVRKLSARLQVKEPGFCENASVRRASLTYAIDAKKEALLQEILMRGADPMLKHKGQTAIEYTEKLLYKYRCSALWVHCYERMLGRLRYAVELEASVHDAGGWRPHLHVRLPPNYRGAMRTLVVLAKARAPDERHRDAKEWRVQYPQACLELLPEELLQYLYAYVASAPLYGSWVSPNKMPRGGKRKGKGKPGELWYT